MPSGTDRFGYPTITDWFAARGVVDPEIVCPVIAAFTARDAVNDDDAAPDQALVEMVVEILKHEGGDRTTGWRWGAAHEIVVALRAALAKAESAQ